MNRRRHPFYAMLAPSSPRYADWLRVFHGAQLPIVTPTPMCAQLPIGEHDVYLVVLELLEEDVRDRLVQHLAEKFNEPVDVARQVLAQEGLPILAEDLTVSIDARFVS